MSLYAMGKRVSGLLVVFTAATTNEVCLVAQMSRIKFQHNAEKVWFFTRKRGQKYVYFPRIFFRGKCGDELHFFLPSVPHVDDVEEDDELLSFLGIDFSAFSPFNKNQCEMVHYQNALDFLFFHPSLDIIILDNLNPFSSSFFLMAEK